MRNINTIIIHHSVSPQDQLTDRSLASFNNTHKMRLYDVLKQPLGETAWPYIAYHYVIDVNGDVYNTRKDSVVGYHASNLDVNKRSIGICLIGNLDFEKASDKQWESLKNKIIALTGVYKITAILPHRAFAPKTCPGNNVTQDNVDELNELLTKKIFFPSYEQQLATALKAVNRASGWRKKALENKIERLKKYLE